MLVIVTSRNKWGDLQRVMVDDASGVEILTQYITMVFRPCWMCIWNDVVLVLPSFCYNTVAYRWERTSTGISGQHEKVNCRDVHTYWHVLRTCFSRYPMSLKDEVHCCMTRRFRTHGCTFAPWPSRTGIIAWSCGQRHHQTISWHGKHGLTLN